MSWDASDGNLLSTGCASGVSMSGKNIKLMGVAAVVIVICLLFSWATL
ncbi:MAG TPA: hypothetical protein IAC83_05860 [Euryarchaeota archaeon]|nr:hypothetical protein [Euryarchaeota archaeon]